MKKKTPEQELKALCRDIRREIDHWDDINENGCNDPFWADGTNMNLTRNHILYAKERVADICEQHSITIPEEMYLPTPPEVDNCYMANLDQKKRVESIRRLHGRDKIRTKRNKYDRKQLSLF